MTPPNSTPDLTIGHFSDVHLLEQARTFRAVVDSLEWAANDMLERGAQLTLDTGDVYGRRVGHVATELERVTRGDRAAAFPWLFILYGNHDRALSLDTLGWREQVSVCSTPTLRELQYLGAAGVELGMVPWASKAEFLRTRQLDKATADAEVGKALFELLAGLLPGERAGILAAHLLVADAQSGGGEHLNGLEPQLTVDEVHRLFELNPQLRYFALGHLHKPQQLGGVPCYYAGQLCAQDYGESSGDRGYNLVRIRGDSWRDTEVEFRKNPHSPVFHTMAATWDARDKLHPVWAVQKNTVPPELKQGRRGYLKLRLTIPEGQQARAMATAGSRLVEPYAQAGYIVDEPEPVIIPHARVREISDIVYAPGASTSTEDRLRRYWSALEPAVNEAEQMDALEILAEINSRGV